MSWRIDVSKSAEKFLNRNKVPASAAQELVLKTILYFQGEDINVNVKKLKGRWSGFYRIRAGRMRIIAEFDFENLVVFVEEIDWRGNVY